MILVRGHELVVTYISTVLTPVMVAVTVWYKEKVGTKLNATRSLCPLTSSLSQRPTYRIPLDTVSAIQ